MELGERKIISLAQYKTNRDYLRAVVEVQPLYGDVKQLTESFERHWYGVSPCNRKRLARVSRRLCPGIIALTFREISCVFVDRSVGDRDNTIHEITRNPRKELVRIRGSSAAD